MSRHQKSRNCASQTKEIQLLLGHVPFINENHVSLGAGVNSQITLDENVVIS